MSDKDQAVDKAADVIKMIVRGWPIYGVVFGMLFGYSELWLDKKISDAIKQQTLEQPAIVGLTGAVQTNTNSLVRVETKVEEVESDTKAILLHLAGED
jgi:hypothetical protein